MGVGCSTVLTPHSRRCMCPVHAGSQSLFAQIVETLMATELRSHKCIEPEAGVEPAPSRYKRDALPLSYSG